MSISNLSPNAVSSFCQPLDQTQNIPVFAIDFLSAPSDSIITLNGSGTATLGALVSSSTGTVSVSGAAAGYAALLPNDGLSVTAAVSVAGNASGATALLSAGATAVAVTGLATDSLDALGSTSAASAAVHGTANTTLALAETSSGIVSVAASSTSTLDPGSPVATVAIVVVGTDGSALAGAMCSSSASASVSAIGNQVLSTMGCTTAGAVLDMGSTAVVLEASAGTSTVATQTSAQAVCALNGLTSLSTVSVANTANALATLQSSTSSGGAELGASAAGSSSLGDLVGTCTASVSGQSLHCPTEITQQMNVGVACTVHCVYACMHPPARAVIWTPAKPLPNTSKYIIGVIETKSMF